jgi:1,4-alpha-glucan branching enzyme
MKRMIAAAWCAMAVVIAAGVGCSHLAPRARAGGPIMTAEGVRFRFFAPSAHRVQVGGDWPGNNWTRGDGPEGEAEIGLMSDDDNDGLWELVVPLEPGRYRYAFRVDELLWRTDPGNPAEVDAGPGGRASEIVVVERDGFLEVR